MKKTVKAGSIAVLALATWGWAAQARADVWDDLAKSYSADVNSAVDVSSQDQSNAQDKYEDLHKKVEKVQVQQAKDSEKLTKEQAKYSELSDQEQQLQTEIDTLKNRPIVTKKFLGIKYTNQSETQQDIDYKTQQLNDLQQRLQKQQAKITETQADLVQTKKGIDSAQVSANNFQQNVLNPKNAELKDATSNAALQFAAQRSVQGILDQQRQNGYDAHLLFTDLQVLQSQNKLNSYQAQALKDSWGNQLNGTLMGQYVNGQIQKAMTATCDPAFQSACSSKQPEQLNKLLDDKLSAAKAGAGGN
jgi:chromosome segregation ATPase